MRVTKLTIIRGGALLLPLFLLGLPWGPGQLLVGLLLLAVWPGLALLTALESGADDSPVAVLERGLIAVAASYALTVVLLLVMAFARVPFNEYTVAFGLGGLALLFSLFVRQPAAASPASKNENAPLSRSGSDRPAGDPQAHRSLRSVPFAGLIGILLIAAVFRIANVHYSDHQGDEADILLRAVTLVHGDREALLTHSKGPGEILVLNAVGAMTGRFDEPTARLPFAIAGAASIGLIALLGMRWFNSLTGLVAGLLGAIDGVLISYARTAQYQSLVLLLSLAAIGCFYRYHRSGGRSRRLHGLGALLLAGSFLFHFESILLLPVVGYLTLGHLRWAGPGRVKIYAARLLELWPSILIFGLTTALFYGPFVLHPNLENTGTYLENRIGGGSVPPFNNLAHFFYFEALKYNSAYYVALFTGLLVAAGVIALLRAQRAWPAGERSAANALVPASKAGSGPLGTLPGLTVAILLLVGASLALAGSQTLSALLIGLGLAAFFALVILSPATPRADRTLWLWIAPPFLIYVFLVNRPGKHHYLFLAALLILVGGVTARIWSGASARWPGLRQPIGRGIVLALSGGLLLLFGAHTVMLLLRSDLEYVLTYPAHKSAFYPTDAAYPYRTRIGFGYPFRLGWQVIGQLKRTGQLEGTWAGNDGGNAPNWYMLNTPATPCYPDYVLRGEITYKGDEDFDVPFEPADFGYVPRYRIWGNERLRMTVLAFDPATEAEEAIDLYETSRFPPPVRAADFAETLSPEPPPEPQHRLEPALVLGEGSELKENAPAEYLERAQELHGRVALHGYDLDPRYAFPGGLVPVTLHWHVQNLLSLRYKVFVHLISADGQRWAQADDFPVCGTSHANTWPPGATVPDRHLLKLPPDMPPGDYALVGGMYEPELKLRLNYFDILGNEQGNSLTVDTITIRPE